MSIDTQLTALLGDILALVPPEEVTAHRTHLMEVYQDGATGFAGDIVWADFSRAGKFLRAGVSNVQARVTQTILNPHQNPEIREIFDHAQSAQLQVGQVIPGSQPNTHFWCIPFVNETTQGESEPDIRCILINAELFSEVIDFFNRDSHLTPAEIRCVYQVIVGLNPTSAAALDAVSVETKRSHLKRALSKLGCASQSELTRLCVSQLIHLIYCCSSTGNAEKAWEDFTRLHLHPSTRLSVQKLPNGNSQRVWEVGPTSGRPVLVIHGYLFPFVLLNARPALERHGLRLVIPVRDGFLDDQTAQIAFRDGALFDQVLDNLACFIRLNWDGPAPVLCHATGAVYGMFLAARHPDIFRNIVAISVNAPNSDKGTKSATMRFFNGISRLGMQFTRYETVSRHFQRTIFSQDAATRFVLRSLFRDCETDLQTMNGEIGAGHGFDWYRMLHAHSVIGIAADFAVKNNWYQPAIARCKTPITFLHGPEDPLTSEAKMAEYVASNPGAALQVLPVGGHLCIASHPDEVWDEIARHL